MRRVGTELAGDRSPVRSARIQRHDGLAASKPGLLNRLVIATGDTASPEAAAFLRKTRCPILEKPFALDELARIVDRVMTPGDSR